MGTFDDASARLKNLFARLWTRYICAEDDDPDYRYWKRMKEFEDAARLREIMIDAVRGDTRS